MSEPIQNPKPEIQNPTNGANLAHVGTAIGAALAILASAYATFQSNQSGQAAIASQHAVTLTQEMLDKARERAHKLEERVTELEKWRAVEETKEKVKGEGTRERSP